MDTKQIKAMVKTTANDVKSLTTKINNLSTQPKKAGKKARRRARLRQQQVQNSSSMNFPSAGSSMNQMVASKASDTGLRRLRVTPRNGLSDQGISFLKCSFAPPDFQASSLGGVPDDYRGPSLVRKHRFVGTQAIVSGTDYYFLLLPTPGIAYWYLAVSAPSAPVAASQWTPVYYSDFSSMFGSSVLTTADSVTKFRFVSNHIELIPTVNQMTWSGQVQSWKIPVTVNPRQGGTVTTGTLVDLWSVFGLQGVNTNLSNQYTGPFIMGLYTACYNANGTFPFQNILDNVGSVPNNLGANDFGTLLSIGGFGFPGFDNEFESMVIKVSGCTATESCIIKTWACVEYQANSNNALYEFSTLSPFDPLALELYRNIISELPVGVPFESNESFWTRVLGIIAQITNVTGFLPGPLGMASRGVNLLSRSFL